VGFGTWPSYHAYINNDQSEKIYSKGGGPEKILSKTIDSYY